MKDSVWKTHKRKYCEIQNPKFSQMEGEYYDDWLFQYTKTYLYKSLYHPQHPWVRILRMQRMFSREIELRAYEEQSQDFEAYQKDTPLCR